MVVMRRDGGQRIRGEAGETYESLRPYLFAVAYRMTGAASDAEDLVQDAWIRYLDAGSPPVASLRAYLTTIVSRLTLDYLKSARVTREQYVGTWLPEPVRTADAIPGPDATAEQREAVSIAFLTLLERLTPDQRIVFVLRSGFGLPFAEIAAHLGRTAAACRQLHVRATRVLAESPERPHPALPPPAANPDAIVRRFLAALEAGDLGTVTSLLADGATWSGDGGAHHHTVRRTVRGAGKVARGLIGLRRKYPDRGEVATIEDVNGAPAIVERVAGAIWRVSIIELAGDRVCAVKAMLNPEKIAYLDRAGAPVQAR